MKKIFSGELLAMSLCLAAFCSSATTYYNQSGGNANTLSNWGTAANGSGTAPANFTTAGDVFNISNGTMYTSAAWTTGAGVTININSTFNPGSSYAVTLSGTVNIATSGIYDNNTSGATSIGTLNVSGSGSFIQDYTGTLSFTSATFSSNSSFTFNRGSNRFSGISQFNFGNLTFNDAFDGPPSLAAGNPLRVQGNLTLTETTGNFVLSTTASLTHSVGGNLTVSLTGSETFIVSNGSGSPTLSVGGNFSYPGTGQMIVNNSSGGATFTVAGNSTFNNAFAAFVLSKSTGSSTMTLTGNTTVTSGTVELCDNTGNATATISGALTINGGEFDVKGNTASASAVSPTLTVNGALTFSSGTFVGNRSQAGTPVVNLSGGVTQSGGQFTGSSNMGSAIINIGTSAVAKDLNQTGGTVHVSNDVDNASATIGNVTMNVYGSIILGAAGHFDLSYEAAGGNNSINVGGSATAASGAIFGGPHCWNRNNCTATLTLKSPTTAGWSVANAAGNLSMTTGDYDASVLCTGSNSRQGIGQFNVVIESGKTVTLNSDIEPGDNRTIEVYGTLITYNGATQYKTARRYATYDNPVLGAPQPNTGAYATNCWTYIYSGATIDAGDVNGLTIENTYSGSVQTAKRHYNSAANYKFSQSAAQVTGNFITATTPSLNTVNSIIINNSNSTVTTGVTLSSPVTITSLLQFLQGRFKTTSTNYPTIDNGGAASGFSTTNATTAGTASFVDGPMRKKMNTASTFIFPVGKSSGTALYRPIAITPGSTSADTYESELINTAPTASGYSTASLLSPLNWNNNTYFWWLTSGTGSVANIVAPYYIDADLSGSPNPYDAYAVVTEWNTSPAEWESKGLSTVDTSAGSGGTFLHKIESGAGINLPSAITNRTRPFDIGTMNTQSVLLPVSLLDFSATPGDHQVRVAWNTATEQNNDHYTIERSRDAEHFESIGVVSGSGNSLKNLSYSFSDEEPLQGVSYYRLTQTDKNGATTVYPMVAVSFAGTGSISLYPNPAHNELTLSNEGAAAVSSVTIYDHTGVVFYEKQITESEITGKMKLDINDLPNGFFSVKVATTSGTVLTYKFLKN